MFFKKKQKNSGAAGRSHPAKSAKTEPSFISRECVIDGHLNCDGEVHIDGVIRGSVNAQTCVIETAGIVQGEVSGDVVHVQGRVLGPIHGRHVYIYQGAHVEGEVLHDSISIENGAYLYGNVRHNAAPPAAGSSSSPQVLPQQPPPQQQKPRVFGPPFNNPPAFNNMLEPGEGPALPEGLEGAEIKPFPSKQKLK